MAMQTYDDARSYFENTLADSITKKVPFRAGLSVWDIKTDPASPRQIAFLQMPGFGINRLWWTGGRYAYVSAHFDGFTDHILGIVDLQNITKPQLVSKAWLPGMNRAAKEPNTTPKGKRYALHHMIVAGNRGYGAWRDGGFTIHDISECRASQAAVAHQLDAAFCRRHAHTAAASRPQACACRRRIQCRELREGHVLHLDRGCAERRQSTAHRCSAVAQGPQLLHHGEFRSAQSARKPPRLIPERDHDLRHLSQCWPAGVRYQGPVRSP